MAQLTWSELPSQTAAAAAEAGAGTENQGHPAPPTGTVGGWGPNQEETQHHDHENLDLMDEDALPKGSNLSGNKSLMDHYPEDEVNSKQTKKTNTGKGEKGNPKK